MENSKRKVNGNTQHGVLPIKIFSESDLYSKWTPICPNADSDLRITGFRVQVDDDQVYSFTQDKARSKSADVLSILSGSDEMYRQEITQTRRSSSEGEKFSIKCPCVIPQTLFQEQALNPENIYSEKEHGINLLLQSTGPSIKKTSQDENETTKMFLSIPDTWNASQDKISKITEIEEGREIPPALELKISSTCIDKKDLEIHIKSQYDNLFSSSINDQQCLNKGYYENEHSVDIAKINHGVDDSSSARYTNESPAAPLEHPTEMTSREIWTEDKIITDSSQTAKLEVVNHNCFENAYQAQNMHPSITQAQTKELAESEKKHIFTNQATTQTKIETHSTSSQTETAAIFSMEKERDTSTQTKQIEIIETSPNFKTVFEDGEDIAKDHLAMENMPVVPSMVTKGEDIKAEENKIKESCSVIQTKEERNSTSSQTETVAIFLMEEERDALTQIKQDENVKTSPNFKTCLVDGENILEKHLAAENLPIVPVVITEAEKIKAEESEVEENCQCSCGHKKQHDCIYKCCYHRDSENIMSTSILFRKSLLYLTSMYETRRCEYCRCRLNRSCSEITSNCAEKLTSDAHPQYCCKCSSAKNVKDSSRCMSQKEELKNPKSIELISQLFNSLSLKGTVVHQPQIEINKSLEQLKEKEQNYVATKVSSSIKIDKSRFLDIPLALEHCLNSYEIKKIDKSRILVNPVDIKLYRKALYENKFEKQFKADAESSNIKSEKGGRKGFDQFFSCQSISSAPEKKSIRSKSKLDSYYSNSPLCPCSVCHNKADLPKKENSAILLSPCGVFLKLKNNLSDKQDKSTSPKIKAENFDYIAKDGWKPHNHKCDEFLCKKIDVNGFIYFGETSEEEFFESATDVLDDACQIVNDHLLSSHPVDESYYSKQQVRKAAEILHKRWFAVVGSKYSDTLEVRNFIQYIKEFSNNLLKALLHSVDNNGNNVLHFAFANNKFDLVDELLKGGFALELLNKANKSGNTPLMICAISQPKECMDWSVVRKCFEYSDVNEQSAKNGQTPLMSAASCGFRIMVDLLLEVGANPNMQDKDGSTALMYAAEHGHEKCVKSLVRHKKCDPTIRDKDGETACSIALNNGYKNIAVLIHMEALQNRNCLQNLHSTERFSWTSINKTTKIL